NAFTIGAQLTSVNGTVFFAAYNDQMGLGVELWKSNGTDVGTVLVKDIRPGNSSSGPSALTNVNGALFFVTNDGAHGSEVWKTDGTTVGTVIVKDINPGSLGSGVGDLINVNGTLFFRAQDFAPDGFGSDLWKSDGTEAGTVQVTNIYPDTDPDPFPGG